jgi:NAD(P)-dependent dehydrogenase (short-subunit alcohol dehydrogenase family)
MREKGGGWIVNLTSAGANLHHGPPFYLGPQGSTMEVYGTTKAALNRITSGLAGDLYGTGIRVNAVGPRVAVMSEGFADLLGELLGPENIESIEEIVEAVVAYCDCREDVTGQVVVSLDLIAEWGLTVRGLDGLARV